MRCMQIVLIGFLVFLRSTFVYANDLHSSTSVADGDGRINVAEGVAKDLKTNKVLYMEKHYQQGDGHFVHYYDPDGFLIVSNKQDFRYSRYLPVVEQLDYRTNIESGVLKKSTQWIVYNDKKERKLNAENQLVAGSGFDRLIKDDWNNLVEMKMFKFDFVVPESLYAAPLKIFRVDCSKTSISIALNKHICFSVASSSVLFGMFFDPIEVAYEKDTKRLVVFRGLTNLQDHRGETYKAEITYAYSVMDGNLSTQD